VSKFHGSYDPIADRSRSGGAVKNELGRNWVEANPFGWILAFLKAKAGWEVQPKASKIIKIRENYKSFQLSWEFKTSQV
jgi:hypothetical protein